MASIGLIIAGFGISHEEQVQLIMFILKFVFLFSCINYPKEIFPEIIQFIVVMNPFYYLIDLLRIVWYMGVDYDTAIRLLSPIHIIIILTLVILSPVISISLFNRVYKKYGIRGY